MEKIFRVSLLRDIEEKRTCFTRRGNSEELGDVLAETKVTLSWVMHLDMVKPEKFHHLHLALSLSLYSTFKTLFLKASFCYLHNFFIADDTNKIYEMSKE